MTIRRYCDPINVKRLWDAIRSLGVTRQTCDLARILKQLQKYDDCSQAQVEQYLKQAVTDGLILPTKRNSGEAQGQIYKITNQELPELEDKDWYCFECHLAGEVTPCQNCFRVFHEDCVKSAKRKFEAQRQRPISDSGADIYNTSSSLLDTSISESKFDQLFDKYTYNEKLCNICNTIEIDNECQLNKSELNYLLKFVLHRIRAWLPNTITHTMAQEDRPEWLTDSELTWRANQLFFEHRDMSVIEVNLNTEFYNSLSEFLADILTVQHNVAIFHGIDSQEYQAAEFMVRDTLHDIGEIRNCSDCYKNSNEKINMKWFTLPCRATHKLVWAKQKGYPYWPAKVIKETSTHCDVRFFGGRHERAFLSKSFVKPISISKETLKIKSSTMLNRAYEELIYHQKLLTDPEELARVKADVKPKRVFKQKTLMPSPTIAANISDSTISSGKRKSQTAVSPGNNSDIKKTKQGDNSSSDVSSGNVINISDCEEEDISGCSPKAEHLSQSSFRFEDSFEQVTSSTENCHRSSPNIDNGMQQLDQPYCDSVEKMRRNLEALTNKKDIIKCAMDSMQTEIDGITNNHNDHLKRLFDDHNTQISATKKKQWCYNCEQDAIYHCCWNTAYCSQTCQQQHWQAEHKKVCRRKRQT